MPQEYVHAYRRRKSKKEPAAGIDALPDEVLQHVLSLLPSREAVRTCVLARRWRHLWRSIPTLRISSFHFTEQEDSALNRFLDNFLLLRYGNAPLDLCEFSISPHDFTADEPLISSWIRQALLCRVQILRVDNHGCRTLKLRNLRLISQHLTTLELDSVCMDTDFSSLLALKNLRMRRCNVVSEKISSQSLKQLTMIRCMFLSHKRVQISVPSIVWLELTDNYEKTPLLRSMPSLVKAFVRLHGSADYCGKEEFGGSCSGIICESCADNSNAIADCVLLKGLSKAESLELVAEPGTAAKNWVEMKGSCNPSQRCFPSKKLKIVEVKCGKFDKRVPKIFMLLTVYGVCIEQINIQRTSRSSMCYSLQKNSELPW